MNPPPAPPVIRPPTRRRWLWIGLVVLLLIPLVALGTIALGVASYFRMSSDTRAMRDGVMKASGVEWRQNIGLNIGGGTFCIVRAGLSFVPLEPELQAAIKAARGVEVGIYERASGTKPPDGAAILAVADKVLSARGWERVVGVLGDENLVSVFIPAGAVLAGKVKCCVLVFDGRQMVMVSARVNAEPLLECLRNQSGLRDRLQSLAAR